jgi:hypothetical protein
MKNRFYNSSCTRSQSQSRGSITTRTPPPKKHNDIVETPAQPTCGLLMKSVMSALHAGQVLTTFLTRNDRMPAARSRISSPPKAASKHDLQKLWPQGVVRGALRTKRQRWQPNSASLEMVALDRLMS